MPNHRWVLTGLSWLAISSASVAQSSPPPRLATQAELRQCLSQHDVVDDEHDSLLPRMEAHEAAVEQLREAMAALVQTRSQLDRSDAAAVAQYNQRVQALSAQADVLNRQSANWRTAQGHYNQRATQVNQRCGQLVYRHRDMEAVLREREAQGRAR